MALTKKQSEQLEKNYQNTWRALTICDENLKENFSIALFTMEDTLKILGYDRDQLVNLKNEVLEIHNIQLYYIFHNINEIIDGIDGQHKTFLYDVKIIDNIVNQYDFYKEYPAMKDKVFYIKKYIEESENYKRQIEKQIQSMIA